MAENEVVLTVTLANGSGSAVLPLRVQVPFTTVTFGEFAEVDADGNLHFVNPTDPQVLYQFTITVQMPGTNTVSLWARWDQSNIYSLVGTANIAAGVAVTLTNVAIPGSGSLLTLYATSATPGTITWSNGALTVLTSDQPIDEPPFTGPFAVPEGFSEQPAQMMAADAHIADGSYTSTDKNDLVAMPFSYVRWGAATLDPNNNLQFKDLIIDDVPVLSIALNVVTAPATNYIWGQWDNNPVFLIAETELTTTGTIQINNVPIYPQNYPNPGQGQILSLYISCSVAAVFNWSNGRVFANEAVLAWPTVETAPSPPSVLGIAQPIIVNNPIFEATMSNGTMTTTGDTTGASAAKMPFNAILIVGPTNATLAVPPAVVAGDIYFNNTPTGSLLLSVNLTATPGPYEISVFYSWDGGDGGIPVLAKKFSVPPSIARSIVNITIANLVIPVTAGAHNLVLYIDGNDAGNTVTWANAVLIEVSTHALFPAFTLLSAPAIGVGGGPPPAFPPPTPPPIGHIPAGVLVGPAIAAAAVPPSVAGITQPIFTFGSATTPPASAAFPQQTTTYPSPPIIINATQNTNTPIWVAPPQPPPSQTTTQAITISGNWGPPRGPALPPVVPTGTRPFMTEVATGGGGGEAMMFTNDEPPPPRRGRRK
jgi:hypothetical protein